MKQLQIPMPWKPLDIWFIEQEGGHMMEGANSFRQNDPNSGLKPCLTPETCEGDFVPDTEHHYGCDCSTCCAYYYSLK